VTAAAPSRTRPVAAFYTPLKSPDHAEPSGDRTIGRVLLASLAGCGFDPQVASHLSTWRRTFDAAAAARLERIGAQVAARLVACYRRRPAARRPVLWVTYQNYHRCPDLLGPVVATALDIPFVLVNPSVSRKPRRSAFRPWLSAARLALRRADLVFAMSPRDLPRLAALRGARFATRRLHLLPPPVDVDRYLVSTAARADARATLTRGLAPDTPILLCVAMMRAADKLDSYRLLAASLARVVEERPGAAWRLVAVGDGPARPDVEAALAGLPHERVLLTGTLPPEALPAVYAAADCLAFPGIGEEFGLVYLEAAAAGLPVVACHGPGPDGTVAPGGAVLTDPDPLAFARGLIQLLDDPAARATLGTRARDHVVAERSLPAFERRLCDGLALLGLPGQVAR
jgi:glycosyltransferase involved in cell wall biosynthesis